MPLADNMMSTCDDKIERKVVEGHKFVDMKHETLRSFVMEVEAFQITSWDVVCFSPWEQRKKVGPCKI
jgi:hypothetical protein